jgi:hypothetical protein
MITRWILVGIISLLMLVPPLSPAGAHVQARWDGYRDWGPLDIRLAGMDHGNRYIFVVVVMHRRWRNSVLVPPRNNIYFDFDAQGGPSSDSYAWVFTRNGHLTARLMRYDNDGQGSHYVRHIDVLKTENKKGVVMRIPRSSLHIHGGFIRWFASTSYRNQTGCDDVCWDFAPNRGMVGHSV